MKKDKWIGGYQPTDKLDTSNPPRQTAHEDKAEERPSELLQLQMLINGLEQMGIDAKWNGEYWVIASNDYPWKSALSKLKP